MKRIWRSIEFLAVGVLLGSWTVLSLAAADKMEASPDSPTVTIQTFQFRPNPIEVKAGTQITWINQDEIRHTVTSGTPENRDGRFDATLAGKGAKFTFTFTQPGTYPFFCDRHQHMHGEIHVK